MGAKLWQRSGKRSVWTVTLTTGWGRGSMPSRGVAHLTRPGASFPGHPAHKEEGGGNHIGGRSPGLPHLLPHMLSKADRQARTVPVRPAEEEPPPFRQARSACWPPAHGRPRKESSRRSIDLGLGDASSCRRIAGGCCGWAPPVPTGAEVPLLSLSMFGQRQLAVANPAVWSPLRGPHAVHHRVM